MDILTRPEIIQKQPSSGLSLNGWNEDRPVLLRPEPVVLF